MKALALYIRYAFRSFVRGRSRSLFGAFCVAVGITSVVALGLVGGNFKNTANSDARKQNRADVSVSPAASAFTSKQYKVFADLKARGAIVDYTGRYRDDSILRTSSDGGASAIGYMTSVDPSKFPFYDRVVANEPAGKTLAQLIGNPNNAVVSQDVIDTLHLQVGGKVVVNTARGFSRTYTIAGIVPDSAPDNSFGGGFFNDFAMVNTASTQAFFDAQGNGPAKVFIKTRDVAQANAVKAYLTKHLGGLPSIKTVADVAKDSKDGSAGFDKFFRIMGLVAVVIGGIGIINTMLVAARRRTKEIAVLKALGMKGRQVVLVFTIEALILAIAGTIVGLLGGIGASILVNRVTEGLAGYSISWSLQLGPLIAGVLVGLVATVLFAYLPVVNASRARPVAALRSDPGSMFKVRWYRRMSWQGFRTFLLVLFLASLMGTLAVLYADLASGTQAVTFGVVAGVGTLVGAAVLTQLFVVMIWIVSKFPAFGRLPLRMAFRSMGTQKRRLGSTLLAMCIGILAIASVFMAAQNLKAYASNAIDNRQKVNVIVQSAHDPAVLKQLNARVNTLSGVKHHDVGAIAQAATLVSAAGKDPNAILEQKIKAKTIDRDGLSQTYYHLQGIEGRDPRVAPSSLTIKKGRALGPQDVGTDHMVVNKYLADHLNLKIGDRLVFADGPNRVSFTIVGTNDPNDFQLFGTNQADVTYMAKHGLTTPSKTHRAMVYLDIDKGLLNQDVAALRHANLHGVLVLDISKFLTVINKMLDKLTLFPEILAALSLFAGVVIIANTVALAMLERRREIGVMKAVGAKRRTIIQFLLVENAIVGLLGAMAGVALAAIAITIMDQQFFKISPVYDPLTIVSLLGLGVLLAVGASALTALPASSETPMTVLRYE